MKNLIEFIIESRIDEACSSFDNKIDLALKDFKKWMKTMEKNPKLEILYSEADQLYAIYLLNDKSSIKWNGEHIGTYVCTKGELIYDDSEYFSDLLNK